ncbi:sushi domain-containing protein 2 isoform 2-T2 [Spinachia spinachia]
MMERFTAVILFFLLSCICRISAQTCEGSCGHKFESCSCRSTCTALKNCCTDYKEYCVEVLPYSGSILGGTDLIILEARFNKSSELLCRFKTNIDTAGYVDEGGRGHCISPLLYQTGWVSLHISSDNGTTFNRDGTWLSVHTGKLDAKFKAILVNSTRWQYYGTPGVGGPLEMTWNTSLVRAERVNVELWGYRETGKPYTNNWQGEWQYLYSLARNRPNNGSFSFLPKPAQNGFSSWEVGAVRVSPSNHSDGIWDVQAAWTEDHALAWHLEAKFRQNSTLWALEKCLAWDQLENQLPDFLSEIIDCPCTLAQARADTGRFHTDYGCDIEKGSVCTYHPGSVHCVRAIQASPKYAAGQQCCYDATGAQVLTGDSIGGSTPDRAHDWGSPPFLRPPRVPGQSHWVYDVLSFYYCCLWSDNCHYYFKHRPSSDCRRYRPPSSAVVFGDPHFITFDGVRYSFNGKGEYTLMSSAKTQLTIQGRTEAVNTEIKATKLTAVAMKEASSDVIEVRLVSGRYGLEVLQNQQTLSFAEQSWMDLHGVAVFSPTSTNVTVMFPSGAGVEVRLREETMTTTVLLPEEFTDSTLGLLGKINGDGEDDLALSNGAISNESALFTYDSEFLLNTYYYRPRHDHSFVPVFFVPENPDDPLANQTYEICTGEGAEECRYDILVGRSPRMGNATKLSFQSHVSLAQDLQQVISCGWLGPPNNGKKQGTRYLQGATVQLSCNDGFTMKGSAERKCLRSGRWSGNDTSCVVPSNIAGIVAGSVVGALALILIITMIVLQCKKPKRDVERLEAHETTTEHSNL